MPSGEHPALRDLRSSLRVAADDLRDLEARVKYRVCTDAETFRDAYGIVATLDAAVSTADREREDD